MINHLIVMPRSGVKDKSWNDYVDKNSKGWWWHREEWLDYSLAYNPQAIDESFAIFQERFPGDDSPVWVGAYPVIIEGQSISMGRGNPVPTAVVSTNPLNAVPMRIAAFQHMNTIIARHGIVRCEIMAYPMKPGDSQPPGATDVELADVSFRTRVIDLGLPEPVRWCGLRKSSHSIIHRLEERYRLLASPAGIASQNQQWYNDLHREVYGNPRPPRTYEMFREWSSVGYAVPYLAVTPNNDYIAGGCTWLVYKDRAYYASAAYKEKDIGKFLVWHSMKDLAARGVRWAELGWLGRAKTDKEKNIEDFKSGFGGADWPIYAFERIYDHGMAGQA